MLSIAKLIKILHQFSNLMFSSHYYVLFKLNLGKKVNK